MSETRSNDATQIINTTLGPQPVEEREGADRAKQARAALESFLDKPLTPELEAEISAGVLRGFDVGKIVSRLVDGNSFLTEEPPPQVTARGQAPVRTPSQIILGIVRATGQELNAAELDDLKTGRRTPGQLINQKVDTQVLPRVAWPTNTPPPTTAHRIKRTVGHVKR